MDIGLGMSDLDTKLHSERLAVVLIIPDASLMHWN